MTVLAPADLGLYSGFLLESDMNLIHEGRAIPILFYAMPKLGKPIKLIVNGEECEARTTKWQDFRNTYWLFRNVAMYVREHLPDGASVRIDEVPENFGAPTKPPVRKSYYKPRPKAPKQERDASPESVPA